MKSATVTTKPACGRSSSDRAFRPGGHRAPAPHRYPSSFRSSRNTLNGHHQARLGALFVRPGVQTRLSRAPAPYRNPSSFLNPRDSQRSPPSPPWGALCQTGRSDPVVIAPRPQIGTRAASGTPATRSTVTTKPALGRSSSDRAFRPGGQWPFKPSLARSAQRMRRRFVSLASHPDSHRDRPPAISRLVCR
jgi:hypothetical protein